MRNGKRSSPATSTAPTPDVTFHQDGVKHTTSGTGRAAAPPTSPTSACCVGDTIARSTPTTTNPDPGRAHCGVHVDGLSVPPYPDAVPGRVQSVAAVTVLALCIGACGASHPTLSQGGAAKVC